MTIYMDSEKHSKIIKSYEQGHPVSEPIKYLKLLLWRFSL